MILDPEVETRSWSDQHAVDDESYRAQIAYLFERSAFYRAKLGGAGFGSAAAAGSLNEIGSLPFTEKGELRETVTPDNPIGSHLCATRDEIVRIYSTSGTTGTPSYIPLTAADLDNWVTGSARSYAASGVVGGQRIVFELQRRAVRRGCRAWRVRADRPLPHPGRHREHRAPDRSNPVARAGGSRCDAVVCRVPR